MPSFLQRCVTVALVAVGALVIVWFAWTTFDALLLIFSAFLVAVGLDGLARLVHKLTGLSRRVGVIVTATALIAGLATALTLGGMNVAARAPSLQKQIAQSIDQIQAKLSHYRIARNLMDQSVGSSGPSGGHSTSLGEIVTGQLSGAATVTLTTLTDMFVVVVIGLYLALQPSLYQTGLLRLFPPSRQHRVEHITAEAAIAVRRWLTGRVVSMTAVAVGSVIGLWVIGISFPLLLGLMAGLLTFIPYLGPLVSAVPALLVAALQSYHAVFYVGALYLSLHIVEGYLLAPLIQKRAVSIAPGFLLSAQVLGGATAGVLGIALATPIALVCAVIIQLSYVHDVMGEEPHLPGQDTADAEEQSSDSTDDDN